MTSGALGLTVYALKGDSAPAVSCFLAGWLIDLDHVFDWVNNLGLRRGLLALINVYNLFPYEGFEESRHRVTRIYIFLHSWELIIGFWGLCIFYPMNPVVTYIFLGFTLHLALDQKFNEIRNHLVYFLIYRMTHRFEHAALIEL